MDSLEHLDEAFKLIDKALKPKLVAEYLAEAMVLAKKLRDNSYAYDADGKAEFEFDIVELADKISLAQRAYSEES